VENPKRSCLTTLLRVATTVRVCGRAGGWWVCVQSPLLRSSLQIPILGLGVVCMQAAGCVPAKLNGHGHRVMHTQTPAWFGRDRSIW